MTANVRYTKRYIILIFLGLWLGACTKTTPVTSEQTARNFVVSLNQKDPASLTSLVSIPVIIRQQDWKSAPDGSGFILGETHDTELHNKDQVAKFFTDPNNKIAVESETPDRAEMNLLTDELKGMEKIWSELNIFIFRRGMGDVEHIFVVGINKQSKVAAVYLN